jgi:hypothetical protein
MTDYNKQTVAQLRQLLKDRGIPSTGLTRKAQIVEKLEEADQSAQTDAPAQEEEQANEDAPPEPVAQVEEEAQDVAEAKEEAPGPAVSKAGDAPTLDGDGAQSANTDSEPTAQPVDQGDAPPVPTATLDGNRETISHIDSDIPPPDQTQAVESTGHNTAGWRVQRTSRRSRGGYWTQGH